MKYLFFDIECACVFKNVAKMCAFGYVLTDEKFRVLGREDILMDPKGKFHLTDRKGNEGLVLPYAYEDFKKYPQFPASFRRIRALLEDKESIVLGHATVNDVNYLNLETKRYHLPSFRFTYYDTQFFYMNVFHDFSHQIGLGAMAEKLGVEFTPHRAVDDAYATMRVCEALTRREETDVSGIIEKYGIRGGRIADYKIAVPVSAEQRKYLAEREEQRAAIARAHDEFYRFVNKNMHRKRQGKLEGKVFCFAKDVETDVPMSVQLVKAIFNSGGKYTSHPNECNVYIARRQGGTRFESAIESGADFVPLDVITAALEEQ